MSAEHVLRKVTGRAETRNACRVVQEDEVGSSRFQAGSTSTSFARGYRYGAPTIVRTKPNLDDAMRLFKATHQVLRAIQSVADMARNGLLQLPLSVPVMIGLERAFRLYADVVRLIGAQRGELDADLGQMQPRNLLVQRFRQHVDFLFVLALVGVELDLRQRLVGE